MSVTDLIITEEAERGFYPTPSSIAGKMFGDLDWHMIHRVLEPSAGKGDLLISLMHHRADTVSNRWGTFKLDVDCCEIDPYLRQILKYNFSEEKISSLYDKRPDRYSRGSEKLEKEISALESCDMHIVHDDFLSYYTYKTYDLIIMNPPFADGDKHLLHALDMQKNGGSIICLLNAETIRNPYSATRKLLIKRLDELNADVRYIEDAFSSAERAANVDVAIIKVVIPKAEFESTFFNRMEEARKQEAEYDAEIHDLVAGDYIEQAVQLYNVEVAATMEFIKEYYALVPHMLCSIKDDKYNRPILTLTVGTDTYTSGLSTDKYMKTVRMKYWEALFDNPKFTKKLTSELREKYRGQIDRMANYEFSAFNIKQVMCEMNSELQTGVEKAILDLFEKLTVEHSWYPECSQNKHYFNGWKTNAAHKIGKKCIIPTHGMFASYSWSKETFDVSTAYKVISDLEKAFSYLDADREEDTELLERLQIANVAGKTKNIYLKYFSVTLYKKGTTHIKFHPEAKALVDRLNIYAARKRSWLPPNYGRATYSNMDTEEKAVVDAFHGTGEEGSGAAKYSEVMANAEFYLSEPTQSTLLIGPGA